MAGRIIDLTSAGVVLPDAILLDSSVIISRFLPGMRARPSYLR
jgi:hypothetical protein